MMTRERELLQQALDALDAITDDVDGTGLNTMPSFDKAIDALREALAQPAPERWMPIETAPKDVTILLYGAKRLEMCVGMHHSRDDWVTDTTSVWMSMYPPTHWMPLPAAPDHLRDTTEKAAPVPLTDTETHAELWKLAVRKGLVTVRSELIDPRNHGTRVSWMQGHDKACDISNDAAAHGIAASPEQPK